MYNGRESRENAYYEKKNEGRAAARNYGAIKAKYPLLLFVDDDCLLSRNYIEENCKQNDGNFVGHNTILDLPFLKFIIVLFTTRSSLIFMK